MNDAQMNMAGWWSQMTTIEARIDRALADLQRARADLRALHTRIRNSVLEIGDDGPLGTDTGPAPSAGPDVL